MEMEEGNSMEEGLPMEEELSMKKGNSMKGDFPMEEYFVEEEHQACRRRRLEAMKREKQRAEVLRKCIWLAVAGFACLSGCFLGMRGAAFLNGEAEQKEQIEAQSGREGEELYLAEIPIATPIVESFFEDENDLTGESLAGTGGMVPGMQAVSTEGDLPDGSDGVDGDMSLGGGLDEVVSFPERPVPGEGMVSHGDGLLHEEASYVGGVLLDAGILSVGNAVPGKGFLSAEGAVSVGEMPETGVTASEEEGTDQGTPIGEPMPEGEVLPAGGYVAGGEVPFSGKPLFEAHYTLDTAGFDENIISQYGIMIDVDDGIVLAERKAEERINPASMTKILTVLVAAEHLREEELDETVEITIDITDYCYFNDCSITGYDLGEEVTVRDLFYGTILPSGADSALALAIYVAGSHEAFVDLMNEKLEEMGLAQTTHFTNCVGLYHEEHYSTAYDIAMILKAAMENGFCQEILSTHIYTTSSTEQHPEGLRISNKFLRKIEDIDTHGEVRCAKTGYVGQAGNCAASFCMGNNGRGYLCVTAGATSSQKCIEDQALLYCTFIEE